MQVVITSIHPVHSEKILTKEKTIELRRRFCKTPVEKTLMAIYATSPIKAIVGYAEILECRKISKNEVTDKILHYSCVDRDFIEKYIGDRQYIYAVYLRNAQSLTPILNLHNLKQKFNFHAPQSHLIARNNLQTHLLERFKNE